MVEGREGGREGEEEGRSWSFLIPAVELLYKLNFMPRNGTDVHVHVFILGTLSMCCTCIWNGITCVYRTLTS